MVFARFTGYNGDFRVKNAGIESKDYGKSETALYSRTNMASYAQMSQKRISSQISNGSTEMGTMAF
jgi:hypothetical protein